MRYTITHRKGPYWLVATTLVAMLMMVLGWAVHRAWNVPAAGNVELLIVFAALLAVAGLTLIFILKLAGSPPWHTTIEAEPHERMLRVESTTVRGASRLAVPFDECVEIRLDTVSRKNSDPLFRLCVVASGGAEHSILEVDRQEEARDVATRLVAEIGCVSTDKPFPLAFPGNGPVVLAIVGLLFAVCMPMASLMGALALPAGSVLWLACVLVMIAFPFGLLLKRTLSQAGFTTHVRNDPAGRVLRVYRRRGLFGWDSWAYPYDDIAEIVAETVDPGAPHPSYGVRIVLGADALLDAFRESDESLGDTLFESTDRQLVRSTAERLARRIGRPWRDATG